MANRHTAARTSSAIAIIGIIVLGQTACSAGEGAEGGHSAPVQPVTMIVPSDLYAFAESMGCEQVSDFYNSSPGVRHPPYLYGLLGNPRLDSAAVVCERTELGRKTFLLVLKFDDSDPQYHGCSHEIEGLNLHGGLSLDVAAEPTLDRLYYVGAGTQKGPNLKPSKPFIRVEYETATVLYCHEGKWLFRSYD